MGVIFCVNYAVFVADWGEEENVFSPARRWFDRKKQAFLTLSPGEQAAAEELRASARPLSSLKPDASASTPSRP